MSGSLACETRAVVAAASIPTSSGMNFIMTAGYASIGDGEAPCIGASPLIPAIHGRRGI